MKNVNPMDYLEQSQRILKGEHMVTCPYCGAELQFELKEYAGKNNRTLFMWCESCNTATHISMR